MEWVNTAKCREEDPELFFPTGATGSASIQADAAKAVCRLCEVSGKCLEWALMTGQESGVWGGLSEEERRSERRSRRRRERVAVAS